MKYLLDTHILSASLMSRAIRRNDLCILQEVADERVYSKEDLLRIQRAGIKILEITDRHLEKLKDVLAEHGDNFDLIRLYTGEGTADVVMLAYVLCERDTPATLFPEEYTIVTKDKALSLAAKGYGIAYVSGV
ncbi:MAG: hypothetical protein Q7K40_02720 [bacterium]|nr:hypothetical protein [bacterium]